MSEAAAEEWAAQLAQVRQLAELMKEFGLTEVVLESGQTTLAVTRQGESVAVATPASAPVVAHVPLAAPAAPPAAPSAAEQDHLHVVRSPMVGTFYASSSPEAPSFVKVGDHIGPETTVCIVEAMKVFNEIPAEVAGKVVAVLVENGEPVEYGQPLFKVDTRV